MIITNPHATVKKSTFGTKRIHPKISINTQTKYLDKHAYDHLLNDYIDIKNSDDAEVINNFITNFS